MHWIYPVAVCFLIYRWIDATPYTYETYYTTQLVDHFSFSTDKTFQHKYLVNKEHWCGNGCPILFFCGSEGRDGTIEMFANENSGWMWDYGKDMKAMIVFAEHRYYGSSKPFPDIDESKPASEQMDKLAYLTTQQTIADFAKLIHQLKHQIYSAPDSPVIAVSGGYGAMLSTWLRMKYPNAVIGAWSSSAPIFQRQEWVDCQLLSDIVTREYAAISENCKNSITKSWKAIEEIINQPEDGPARLSAIFNLCTPLTDKSEIGRLLFWLNEYWYMILMTDYPSKAEFYAKLPARPAVEICKIIDEGPQDLTSLQLVERISKAVQFFLKHQNESTTCFNTTKTLYPQYLFEVQAGLELILAHCTDGKTDMFYPGVMARDPVKWESYYKGMTGLTPRFDALPALYHTQDLSPYSHLIFTLPTRDPYQASGPRHSLPHRSIYSWPVEGATWMEELRGTSSNDTEPVLSLRRRVADTMKSWVREHKETRSIGMMNAEHQRDASHQRADL